MSKVRNGERGAGGVERRLIALGGRPRIEGEQPGRASLEEALQDLGARVMSHRGNHRLCRQLPRVAAWSMTVSGREGCSPMTATQDIVERAINRLKHARAVATHYAKHGYVFLGTATAAALVIWLRT